MTKPTERKLAWSEAKQAETPVPDNLSNVESEQVKYEHSEAVIREPSSSPSQASAKVVAKDSSICVIL